MPKSRKRVKVETKKTKYGCHQCGRIGTLKSIRVVDKKMTYGVCWDRDGCLRRRQRKVGWKDQPMAETARREELRKRRPEIKAAKKLGRRGQRGIPGAV